MHRRPMLLARVCRADVVPLPSHRLKLRRRFTWIVPNLQHDMHDGSPAQASAWLRSFLGGTHGLLHRRPYTRGHTAVFIWFDSASQTGRTACGSRSTCNGIRSGSDPGYLAPSAVSPSARRRRRMARRASRMSERTKPLSAPWRLAGLRPSRATRSSLALR